MSKNRCSFESHNVHWKAYLPITLFITSILFLFNDEIDFIIPKSVYDETRQIQIDAVCRDLLLESFRLNGWFRCNKPSFLILHTVIELALV